MNPAIIGSIAARRLPAVSEEPVVSAFNFPGTTHVPPVSGSTFNFTGAAYAPPAST